MNLTYTYDTVLVLAQSRIRDTAVSLVGHVIGRVIFYSWMPVDRVRLERGQSCDAVQGVGSQDA